MKLESFIGSRIRMYRKQNNMTQGELGKAINVGLTTISGYERGANSPDNEKLYLLANVLNTSINNFFPCTTNGVEDLKALEPNEVAVIQSIEEMLVNSSSEERKRLLQSIDVAIKVHQLHR